MDNDFDMNLTPDFSDDGDSNKKDNEKKPDIDELASSFTDDQDKSDDNSLGIDDSGIASIDIPGLDDIGDNISFDEADKSILGEEDPTAESVNIDESLSDESISLDEALGVDISNDVSPETPAPVDNNSVEPADPTSDSIDLGDISLDSDDINPLNTEPAAPAENASLDIDENAALNIDKDIESMSLDSTDNADSAFNDDDLDVQQESSEILDSKIEEPESFDLGGISFDMESEVSEPEATEPIQDAAKTEDLNIGGVDFNTDESTVSDDVVSNIESVLDDEPFESPVTDEIEDIIVPSDLPAPSTEEISSDTDSEMPVDDSSIIDDGGEAVESLTVVDKEKPKRQKGKSKLPQILFLLLLVAGAGYYFLFMKNTKPVAVKTPVRQQLRKTVVKKPSLKPVVKIEDPYIFSGAGNIQKDVNEGIITYVYDTDATFNDVQEFYRQKIKEFNCVIKMDDFKPGRKYAHLVFSEKGKDYSNKVCVVMSHVQ
jgi:hypothetical protein